MAKEIRKETDWLGREKNVIYEDGTKVGETRHEEGIFGGKKDVTYDTNGNKISETRHKTTLFGTSKEVTYDTHGNKVSETRHEEGIFGRRRGDIHQNGQKIGTLKTEKGIFGGRKQVLQEVSGDVDLKTRTAREKYRETSSSRNSYYSIGESVRMRKRRGLASFFFSLLTVGGILTSLLYSSSKLIEYSKNKSEPSIHVADEKYDFSQRLERVIDEKYNLFPNLNMKKNEKYDYSRSLGGKNEKYD